MSYPDGPYLVDTSILMRIDDPDSPIRQDVLDAVRQLMEAGNLLYLAPQSLVEFWVVATRPRANNGLGLTPTQAATRIGTLKTQFVLLPETPALFDEWERLSLAAQVSGRQAHDTRLAAFTVVQGIPNILTLNPTDFKRFPPLTGLVVVEQELPSQANP